MAELEAQPRQTFRGMWDQILSHQDEIPNMAEVEVRVFGPKPASDPLLALLESWLAEAPTDEEAIREAEEDLREFKRNMNLPRKEAGASTLSRGGMSVTVFLDTGPLGILTNPKRPPETVNALTWAVSMLRSGYRFIVPAIADYEVRRELERTGKTAGIAALDAWNHAAPERYLPLSDSALHLGAHLWARARNSGTMTADPKELDADVLIAAQALDARLHPTDFIVATVHVGHLDLFVPAERWANSRPYYRVRTLPFAVLALQFRGVETCADLHHQLCSTVVVP